jgi:hypothetical protein
MEEKNIQTHAWLQNLGSMASVCGQAAVEVGQQLVAQPVTFLAPAVTLGHLQIYEKRNVLHNCL